MLVRSPSIFAARRCSSTVLISRMAAVTSALATPAPVPAPGPAPVPGLDVNRNYDFWRGTNTLPSTYFGAFVLASFAKHRSSPLPCRTTLCLLRNTPDFLQPGQQRRIFPFVCTERSLGRAGQWSLQNPDCVPLADTSSGVRTFLLCFCVLSVSQGAYFMYHILPTKISGIPKARRSTWEFAAVPLVEAFVYGLAYSDIGKIRLYDGRAVHWLRTVGWMLTVPVLLMQIGKMSVLKVQGVDVSSLITWLGIVMITFGFSASLCTDPGLKWFFFVCGFVCLIVIFYGAYRIMFQAGQYYISLSTQDGTATANRVRALMFLFFVSWALYPLFFLLSIEGVCVVEESVIMVCFTLLDCLSKNMFGLVLWDTLWNTSLGGRWTSNPDLMAAERNTFQYQDDGAEDFESNAGQLVPYTEQGGVEVDVVMRPGSAAQRATRASITGSKIASPYPGRHQATSLNASVVPMEAMEAPRAFAMGNGDGMLLAAQPRTSGISSPVLVSKQSNAFAYAGSQDGYNYSMGPVASNLRSRQQSLERALPDASLTPGAGQMGSVGQFSQTHNRDSGSMDDVVDHVRTLNQALTDLLTTEPTNGARAHSENSHTV